MLLIEFLMEENLKACYLTQYVDIGLLSSNSIFYVYKIHIIQAISVMSQ